MKSPGNVPPSPIFAWIPRFRGPALRRGRSGRPRHGGGGGRRRSGVSRCGRCRGGIRAETREEFASSCVVILRAGQSAGDTRRK